MAGLIYKIENLINGKVYIGQTRQGLQQRKREHLSRLQANERQHKLYQAMRKHGVENFKFSKLASVPNESDLDAVEEEIISQYNSFNRGYNATPGGGSVSEETRRKLSKSFKGRKITWMEKIVEAREKNGTNPKPGHGGLGRHNKHSKSYLVRTPEGEKIKFKGLRGFCRERGLSHNLLLTTLTGMQSQHKGYVLLKKFND